MSDDAHLTTLQYIVFSEDDACLLDVAKNWPMFEVSSDWQYCQNFDLIACLSAGNVRLHLPKLPQFSAIHIDFNVTRANFGKDPLLKALGKHKNSVIDLTAGWGGDALHIASQGSFVTAIEQHAFLALLLSYAHNQICDANLKNRLQFVRSSALSYMHTDCPENVDVVYLDPMYPDKKKTAATNKKMQILQLLHSHENLHPDNEAELLVKARQIARHRVVVKRPHHAPPIALDRAGYTQSKLLRFDIYKPEH